MTSALDMKMKQNARKQAFINKFRASNRGSFNLLSVSAEEMRRVFEKKERSSENRFELLASSAAVQSFFKATKEFESRRGLEVNVTKRSEEIPDLPENARFKYSQLGDCNRLQSCSFRIKEGEEITVALVREEGLLIGYGIAVSMNAQCKIEIVDVDQYSRREAGLEDTFQLDNQSFHVGVGHVVVNALLEVCHRPIHVDATNSRSRYIFKSLGFVHDDRSTNPCMLIIE